MPRGTNNGSIFRKRKDPETGLLVDLDRLVVRKRYTDLKGRPREKKRYASTPKQAERLQRAIQKEIADELAGVAQGARAQSFNDLITFYKAHEMKPAEYVGDTKIAGLRSFAKFESRLKPIEVFFGPMALPAITYQDIADFKRERLMKKSDRGTDRSIASVNRELSMLRHLFFLALRERWIAEHPFHRGKPLIQIADEVSRMRILSYAEETALLNACTGRRSHLRLEILTAIETALRQGEQLTLERDDIDLASRAINLRAFNSKTAKRRVVPITSRLAAELAPHMTALPADETLVFSHRDPKRAFAKAREVAKITGLRWHDLRHTAITRMLHFYKLPAAEVMNISGHTNWKTFLRYVNIDTDVARSISARIDAARAEMPSEDPPKESEIVTSDALN